MPNNTSQEKPKYLVTGANGFVASVLTKHLLSKGISVRAMVRNEKNGEQFKKLGGEVAVADLRDIESLKSAVAGITGVYHIAAIYREAGLPETLFHEINAQGTKNMLDASIAAGVKRFIHCSTGGVLGDVKTPPGGAHTPYGPGDMYQRSKVEAEKIVLDYFNRNLIRGVVIRPGMIYGPGDTRHLKMFKMIANGTFFYVGRGDKSVHFIDVRDLAKSFELAMEREDLHGKVYHIAGEKPVPLYEAVSKIASYMKVPAPKIHLPVRPVQLLGTICEAICTPFRIQPPIFRRRVDFFTKNRDFDTVPATNELGFQPKQSIDGEIRETVDWYREHKWIS